MPAPNRPCLFPGCPRMKRRGWTTKYCQEHAARRPHKTYEPLPTLTKAEQLILEHHLEKERQSRFARVRLLAAPAKIWVTPQGRIVTVPVSATDVRRESHRRKLAATACSHARARLRMSRTSSGKPHRRSHSP